MKVTETKRSLAFEDEYRFHILFQTLLGKEGDKKGFIGELMSLID